MSKEIKRMTYEERVKWHEEHLARAYGYCWIKAKEGKLGCALTKHLADIGFTKEKEYNPEITDKVDREFAEWEINDFLFLRPYKEQKLHKQEWLGCDLREVHEEIRENLYETCIVCLIKDGKISKKYSLLGYTSFYILKDSDLQKYLDEAKEMGAAIYLLHNHPLTISVEPSIGDLNGYKRRKKLAEKANVKINFGIISCEDYWDYEQSGKTFDELIEEGKQNSKLVRDKGRNDGHQKLSLKEILFKIEETATE